MKTHTTPLSGLLAACLLTLVLVSPQLQATMVMKPTPNQGLAYADILSGDYDAAITTPEAFLGFPAGQKTATPEQINQLVNLWAAESDKANIIEYARTYEGRALHYLIISSVENINKIEQIKSNISKLAHPDKLGESEISRLISETPATAWMAYSIHGNESSGADAALALIYHLIASEDADITGLLDSMVVLVDPMMNPDGRARFTKNMQENRGAAPNLDSQSLLHTGVWPFGRTNHYYFDLNRDFYFAANPESRGRIKAINQWYPLLMVDIHEMGSLDTYLFGPPREPINEHIPRSVAKWSLVFAADQAATYDRKGWPYYTGEWFESLYPGYSNYAEYRGSIHILYEQAKTSEDGIRLENGHIRSYRESVDHQFVSSLANLKTLQKNSAEIYRDFVKNRLSNIARSGPYANRSYVVLPSENTSRLDKLLELLQMQDIEYFINTKPQDVDQAKNHLGQTLEDVTIPAGALVIPNRQYEAPLIAAILEFDAKIKDPVLLEERQKTLRNGDSIMYDATAWNLTMMYGLPALEVPQHISSNLEQPAATAPAGIVEREDTIAYIVDGASDASVGFAARLLEQDVQVRVLDKDGLFNGLQFNRGSVVVYKYDNRIDGQILTGLVQQAALSTGTRVQSISQGLGEGDLPDIGGQYFRLLKKPQVAMLTQSGINPGDFGSIWHMLDTELGIRHSHLSQELLNRMDLRPYNVLVVPSRYYGSLSKANIELIDAWVKNGGTLIVNGSSANQLASEEGFSKVVLLKDSFEKASEFNIALVREYLAQQDTISNNGAISSHTVPGELWFPWTDRKDLEPMDKEQLEQWDNWTSEFMPAGAMAASRTDQKHWLTYGVDAQLPVLIGNAPLFMAKEGVDAVVRYGALVDNPAAKEKYIGWASIPKGKDIYLRMSGLIWPEGAQRLSNAAYLTRERKGNGQIILFANMPNFRAATKGTARLLLNAIVYGPGLGANNPVDL